MAILIWRSKETIPHEEKALERVISAILLPVLNGKQGIGPVKSGNIMLKNIKTSKFYRIKKEDVENSTAKRYNMLVVETEDGELVELLFTDRELQKSVIRSRCHARLLPKYTLGCNYSISVRMAAVLCALSALLGYLINSI